ncbi:50S ribosomal protein L4 [Candidatus Daviesbacteria bacterium]|nr:50S ribosomal protein L4 [Candidatus Daviesbacteria bacterium]
MPKVKKEVVKKVASKTIKSPSPKESGYSVPVYSLTGTAAGSMQLPKEIFGQKINEGLLAQAVRVYVARKKVLTGSTKSRGEVAGSTAKIYRQKGTGRARHGAIRAPIFVGGGITFGPKPRKVELELPKKMRRAALVSALSAKFAHKEIIGLTGADKASGKTSQIDKLITKLSENKKNKNSTLILTGTKADLLARASRNIPEVATLPADMANAYEVLKYKNLVLTKDGVEKLTAWLSKEEK